MTQQYNTNKNICFERRNSMSNKEKLIQFIEKLTNEETEKIIAYLETVSTSEEVVLPPPPNIVPQVQ